MMKDATNAFLTAIVPDNMTLCLVRQRTCPDEGRGKFGFRPTFYLPHAKDRQRLDKAIELALSEADTNWYFAVSGYDKGRRRKRENVTGIKVLLLDIDIKADEKFFSSKAEAIPALKKLQQTCPNLPAPWIVDSGFGLHVYYVLDQTLTADQWAPIATLFANVVKAVAPKLIADPVRTRDAASVMRLPGSHNAKTNTRIPVRIMNEGTIGDLGLIKADLAREAANHNLSGVDEVVGNELVPNMPALPAYMDVATDAEFGLGMENALRQEFSDLELRPILEGCKQMRELCMKKGDVEEPFWMLQLRVLNTVKNPDDVACFFSSGHPTYSEAGTRRKMRHIRENFDAATTGCEEFKIMNKSGCYNCPNAKKVWTPSQLAVVAVQNEEETAAKEEAHESAESGVVTSQGYIPQPTYAKQKRTHGGRHEVTYLPVRQPGKKAVLEHEEIIGGHVNVAHSTAMVHNVVVNHEEQVSMSDVRVHLDVVNMGYRNRTVISSKELTSSGYDASTDTLRSSGLVFETAYPAQKAALSNYLHELVRLSAHKRLLFRPRKGWLKSGREGEWSFVAGARHYKADGRVENNVTSAEHFGEDGDSEGFMERNCSGIPKGRLDRWKKGMEIYDGSKMVVPQLLILSGMANLLMPLFSNGRGGIVLSLVGDSGKGKTTLLNFMCSFMGDYDRYSIPGDSTVNAIGSLLGQANCLMLPVDDTVTENAEYISQLLSMVTGGQEKMRMTWDSKTGGTTKYNDKFYTSILISSNKSTTATIGTGGSGRNQLQTEAARSRTLEFPASLIKAPDHISKDDWDASAKLVSRNHGHAVDMFLRHIVVNQVQVINELNRLESKIYKELTDKVDADKGAQVRFWSRFLAVVAMTAKIVGRDLNLVKWDHRAILNAGLSLVESTVAHASSSDYDLVEDFWSACITEPNPSYPRINFVTRKGHERLMGDWRTETRRNRMLHSEWTTGSFLPTGQVNGTQVDEILPAASNASRWRIDSYDIKGKRGRYIQRERTIFIPRQELLSLVQREAGHTLAVTDWADLSTRLKSAGCQIFGLKEGEPYVLAQPHVYVKIGASKITTFGASKAVVEIRLPPQKLS